MLKSFKCYPLSSFITSAICFLNIRVVSEFYYREERLTIWDKEPMMANGIFSGYDFYVLPEAVYKLRAVGSRIYLGLEIGSPDWPLGRISGFKVENWDKPSKEVSDCSKKIYTFYPDLEGFVNENRKEIK